MIKNLEALSRVAGVSNVRLLDATTYGLSLHPDRVRHCSDDGEILEEMPVHVDYKADFVVSTSLPSPREGKHSYTLLVSPRSFTQGDSTYRLGPFTHLSVSLGFGPHSVRLVKRNQEIAGVVDIPDPQKFAMMSSLVFLEGPAQSYLIEGEPYVRCWADHQTQNKNIQKAIMSGDALMLGLTLLHIAKTIHNDVPLALFPKAFQTDRLDPSQRLSLMT